jgi:hypothetical protein
LADSLEKQKGTFEGGAKRIKKLFALIDAVKRAKGSDGSGSFTNSAAIREIILGIYSAADGVRNDYYIIKAIDWVINSTLRGFSREALAELLDDLVEIGYLPADKKDEILDAASNFEKDAWSEDKTSNDRVTEIRRIKDLVREDYRSRTSERRQTEEQEKQEAPVPEPLGAMPTPTTSVQLTSFDGPTEVSRRSMGEIQSIQLLAKDGSITRPAKNPDFDDHKDSFTLTLPEDLLTYSILIGGTTGALEIFQDGWTPDAPHFFGPRDLEIVTRNTNVNETIFARSPAGDPLLTGPLDDYAVTIDGQPIDIVAIQPDEIAINGSGIQPNESGSSEVILTENENPIAYGIFDTWGYQISTTEVTERNVWVPVYLQSTGIGPTQLLKVTLKPTEGQVIEPLEIIISGAESSQMTMISQLKTEKLGPQLFFVTVEKMD